jgi:hypothetical protein
MCQRGIDAACDNRGVQIYDANDLSFHETAAVSLSIAARPAAKLVARAGFVLWRNEILVITIAAVLAAVGGVLELYANNSFGSVQDYLLALLWGFGIEKTVRGFNAVYAALGSQRV